MEMHQIRYFLALSETLNFTRAAEDCNVAQPSLTRAIKKLEEEFGGELFRRERSRTHLSELGRLLLPVMQQTYDSAAAAKDLAQSFHKAGRAPLGLALSQTIDTRLVSPFISELARALSGLEIQIFRGSPEVVAQHLKDGDAELAVSGPLGDDWDRFDTWELFTEKFAVMVPEEHPSAKQAKVALNTLNGATVLPRPYCEHRAELSALCKANELRESTGQQVPSDSELIALVEAGLGIAIVPASTSCPKSLRLLPLETENVQRAVNLYSVAGRQRSPAATTMMKYLRAADWSTRI